MRSLRDDGLERIGVTARKEFDMIATIGSVLDCTDPDGLLHVRCCNSEPGA